MSASSIRTEAFAQTTCLVLGDAMLDVYVHGEVARISPEAPIPVLTITSSKSMPGGAANVAANLAALGAKSVLLGVVGADSQGQQLRQLMTSGRHEIVDGLLTAPDRPTTVKTRYMCNAHQMLRADQECRRAIPVGLEDALLAQVQHWIGRASLVVLSDYDKGVLTPRLLAEVMRLAAAAGKPVIVDPKRDSFAAYRGATLIKPNVAELQRATGIDAHSDAGVAEAAGQLIEKLGMDVLVTRSEKGMSLFRKGHPPAHASSQAREVFDVSGAGDTALAAFAVALASGADAADAMQFANTASGIAVTRLGTAVISLAEIKAAQSAQILEGVADRIVSADRAAAMCRLWRDLGLRIGFTNGCFDILHAGHVTMLKKVAAQCDRLVVALNTDASVRRLKGPSRPVQDEASRAQVIASLAAVDLVVLFDADTPVGLIESLEPDLLAKGADYQEHEVVGADLVKARGGKVVLVDLVPDQSTTNAIRRAKGLGSAPD